jgi:hypothetical protein
MKTMKKMKTTVRMRMPGRRRKTEQAKWRRREKGSMPAAG